MKLIDMISCAFGNHKYSGNTTKVTMVTDKVCRVEVQCVHCGRHNCFLADFNALERYAEACHDEMLREGVAN